MSSGCLLSSAPATPEPELELELLVLRRSPRKCNNLTPIALLKLSTAHIFTVRLFTCTALDTSLATVLYRCTQPGCNYTTSSPLHRVLSISNLSKHYHGVTNLVNRGMSCTYDEQQLVQLVVLDTRI